MVDTLYKSSETLKKFRGHLFTPPKVELRKVPKLYDTDRVDVGDKIVYLHYFSSSMDWYVTEMDQETGECFGYVKNGSFTPYSEWGYFSLNEMESVRVGFRLIERDCWWTPVKFGGIK